MSAWKLLVKTLWTQGGMAEVRVLRAAVGGRDEVRGLTRARRLGLVEPGACGVHTVRLTDLGRDFAAGRARLVRVKPAPEHRGRYVDTVRRVHG